MRFFDLPQEPLCTECGGLCRRVDFFNPKELTRKGVVCFRHVDNSCLHAGKSFTLPIKVYELQGGGPVEVGPAPLLAQKQLT